MNVLEVISPPETNFLFNYWGHMIPPIRPEHSLFLGYGQGVTPELMRKIWGQCKITAVDKSLPNFVDYSEYSMLRVNAEDFVFECTKDLIKTRFDYIAVDLWNGGEVCEFVYDPDFAKRLKQMTKKYLCVNIPIGDVPKMHAYYDVGFKFERNVAIEGNMILWWSALEE